MRSLGKFITFCFFYEKISRAQKTKTAPKAQKKERLPGKSTKTQISE